MAVAERYCNSPNVPGCSALRFLERGRDMYRDESIGVIEIILSSSVKRNEYDTLNRLPEQIPKGPRRGPRRKT
jgi:hypothetical protein